MACMHAPFAMWCREFHIGWPMKYWIHFHVCTSTAGPWLKSQINAYVWHSIATVSKSCLKVMQLIFDHMLCGCILQINRSSSKFLYLLLLCAFCLMLYYLLITLAMLNQYLKEWFSEVAGRFWSAHLTTHHSEILVSISVKTSLQWRFHHTYVKRWSSWVVASKVCVMLCCSDQTKSKSLSSDICVWSCYVITGILWSESMATASEVFPFVINSCS